MEVDNKNVVNQNNTTIEIKLENNNIPENVEPKQPLEHCSTKIRIETGIEPDEKDNSSEEEKEKEKKENEEEKKENEEEKKENEEEKKENEEENYDLNKDYNFLSILQFVNLFHKVLSLAPISTTELEFSLLHTDIDPLCCNVLSKLLQKKEQHRPTKINKEKDKEKEKEGNFTESNNNLIEKSSNNLTQKEKEINNSAFNQENLIQLNEELLKKINYFYKIYIRYLKKIYNVTENAKLLEMIKNDTEIYNNTKYENDFYSFTKFNLSNKYYDDCDIKTELIVKLFRDLNGEHPLRNINTIQELEILMSNKDNDKNNQNFQSTTEVIDINNNSIISEENNSNIKSFETLKVKQKVILLNFFCNYCMTFSGRQPLFLEEIMSNTEENFVNNKKILPLYFDSNSYNYYIFPLNKDCRIYKEKIESWHIVKSIKESFDIKIKNYSELEKLLEEEKDQNIVKTLKDKLLEFKANDEEEQKKVNSNLKKEEMHLKAKKLREMNKNCSEIEKFKNTDYILMNMSNHMMTRRQLNQITQLSQVTTRNKYNKFNSLILKEKPKELTEEEKRQMKIQKEKLEREKRMEKRNRMIEKMQKEEEYKLTHPEEAQKLLNIKKKREKEKKKHKKRHTWSDEESEYDDNEMEEELIENYDESDSEKKIKKKKNHLRNIVISDDDDDDVGENMYQPKKRKIKNNNEDNNIEQGNQSQEGNTNANSEIINDGYLIYRYCSNQIELDGNWYVADDPSWKERISYLFSGSQTTKSVSLNIENTEVNINLCSANLVECIQLDILFKNCLEFLAGDYSGYFVYYSKTIEERFNINFDIEDSLVKISGSGNNSLGNFNLSGYFNFFRNKDIIKEKNSIEDQVIKIAEFKINKNYTVFNPTENEKVIK